MAKKKSIPESSAKKAESKNEPLPNRAGFIISMWTIIVGLVAQIAIAIAIYPHLPSRIPTNWLGALIEGRTVPSWLVFAAFPGAQVVLLLIGIFSLKDGQGKRVMHTGKAISLVLLAILFTILQYSVIRYSK